MIAGVLAKWVMPVRDPDGIIITILIGIASAVLGGCIGWVPGIGAFTAFNFGSFFLAILGSLIKLWGYRKLS